MTAASAPRVLVACEFSGVVWDEFIRAGCNAVSCDLLPTERPGPHYQGNVFDILRDGWDLMIAFPPCTHISVSGARHFWRKEKEQAEALSFFRRLLDAPVPRICIENPVGVASSKICRPSQIVHPWQFGDEAEKTTCLWLRWLPLLIPTKIVGRGEFHLLPNGNRIPKWYSNGRSWKTRSRTFPGIARAMADQFSPVLFRRLSIGHRAEIPA